MESDRLTCPPQPVDSDRLTCSTLWILTSLTVQSRAHVRVVILNIFDIVCWIWSRNEIGKYFTFFYKRRNYISFVI